MYRPDEWIKVILSVEDSKNDPHFKKSAYLAKL